MEIEGNVALVTGGASGLGEASLRRLVLHGARVVLCDLNDERANAIVEELGGHKVVYVRTDIRSEDDVLTALGAAEGLGQLVGVVHCAGAGIAARTLNRDGTPHPLDDFRKVIELNLVGTFNVLRLASSAMARNEPNESGLRGAIVNTASIAAFEGQIGQIAYGASKAGIVGMTIIAARDLAAVGVRTCTIAPGTMFTPAMTQAPQEFLDHLTSSVASPKRLGDPDEFAFLAQHIIENDYLNGETIRLDGGNRFPAK